MALPAPGLTLADKQAVTRELLRCGATISEINCAQTPLGHQGRDGLRRRRRRLRWSRC